jgi:hypothetical protein
MQTLDSFRQAQARSEIHPARDPVSYCDLGWLEEATSSRFNWKALATESQPYVVRVGLILMVAAPRPC